MRYKWTIEIEVDQMWTDDGFDLKNEDDIVRMLQERLPFAYSHELGGKVIKRPKIK